MRITSTIAPIRTGSGTPGLAFAVCLVRELLPGCTVIEHLFAEALSPQANSLPGKTAEALVNASVSGGRIGFFGQGIQCMFLTHVCSCLHESSIRPFPLAVKSLRD